MDELDSLRERVVNLERALATRAMIGRAVGIVMERFELEEQAAFDFLANIAARTETSVANVAEEFTATRRLPGVDAAPSLARDPRPLPAAARAWHRFGLSGREVEVLRLVASGVTNEEIGRSLFVSVNTVKTYVRTAYRKIGVTRRAQAVIWAHQHGLSHLDPAEPLGEEQ